MGFHYIGVGDIPSCCNGCICLGSDFKDEYSPSYFYCGMGMMFPTKKQKCKRKPKIKDFQ